MRDKVATTILWTEAIWFVWIMPLLKQYLIYSGIVFNVFILLLYFWR